MPVTWEYRGPLLVVTESGITPNAELERAFIHEALADQRAGSALRVLWDARGSERPVSGGDITWRIEVLRSLAERGLLFSLALLVRGGHVGLTAGLGPEMAKEVKPLRFDAFNDESEALAWLNEEASPR
jgi:hypothetical protein